MMPDVASAVSGHRRPVVAAMALSLLMIVVILPLRDSPSHYFGVLGLPLADEVTYLPDFVGPLPSRHFSGYVTSEPIPNGGVNYIHYYWVYPVRANPLSAPVIMWTNGGPGCSSLEGWGYELGPFQFNRYRAPGPVFTVNPNTWATNAHVVFIENPPGVGFSYRADGNYTTDDVQNALSNYQALVDLFARKFPEFAGNGLYLSGESYAGIYVPTLAANILSPPSPLASPSPLLASFRGIIVGNGVTDNTYDSNFGYSTGAFAAGHGLMSPATAAAMQTACLPPSGSASSTGCKQLENDFYSIGFPSADPYGYVDPCFNPTTTASFLQRADSPLRDAAASHAVYRTGKTPWYRPLRRRGSTSAEKQRSHHRDVWRQLVASDDAANKVAAVALGQAPSNNSSSATLPPAPNETQPDISGADCSDDYVIRVYLNRPDVKAALHVNPSPSFAICYDLPYSSTIWSVVNIYETLIAANRTIVVYNGNTDLVVPYTGTWAWIQRSTQWQVTRQFAPWLSPDVGDNYGPQLGGYAMQYNNAVWFVLINGAGHMVPQDRPVFASAMLDRILTGQFFPESLPGAGMTFPPSAAPAASPSHLAVPATALAFFVGAVVGVVVLAFALMAYRWYSGGASKTARHAHSSPAHHHDDDLGQPMVVNGSSERSAADTGGN